MTLVTVDSNLLTGLYIGIIVAFAVATGAGMYVSIIRLGPAGRAFWNARRKHFTIIFRRTRGGIVRIEEIAMSYGGVLRKRGQLSVIPEQATIANLTANGIGGQAMGLVDAMNPTTLPASFLFVTEKFNAAFRNGREIAGLVIPPMPPDDLESYMDDLTLRQQEIKKFMESAEKIKRNDSEVEEEITSILSSNGIDPANMTERKRARMALQDAIGNRSEELLKELKSIDEIKTVKFKVNGFDIHWATTHAKKSWKSTLMGVGTHLALSFTDYPAWRMSEAQLDDLFTSEAQNKEANIARRGAKNHGLLEKWVPIGIVLFLTLLGVYLVVTGLK